MSQNCVVTVYKLYNLSNFPTLNFSLYLLLLILAPLIIQNIGQIFFVFPKPSNLILKGIAKAISNWNNLMPDLETQRYINLKYIFLIKRERGRNRKGRYGKWAVPEVTLF
jgi:hypothetical protein